MAGNSIDEFHRIAHELAREMARDVDPNEVGKVLAFWRRWREPRKVFELLQRLPDSGLVRTGKTKGYFLSMSNAFDQYLRNRSSEEFGYILGWAFRLMRFYSVGQTPSSSRKRSKR